MDAPAREAVYLIVSFVCEFKQNVGMARLIKRAPTGEVFPAKRRLNISDHRRFSECVFEAAHGKIAADPFAEVAHRIARRIVLKHSDATRVSPFCRPPDIDSAFRLSPALSPFHLYALWHSNLFRRGCQSRCGSVIPCFASRVHDPAIIQSVVVRVPNQVILRIGKRNASKCPDAGVWVNGTPMNVAPVDADQLVWIKAKDIMRSRLSFHLSHRFLMVVAQEKLLNAKLGRICVAPYIVDIVCPKTIGMPTKTPAKAI